MQWLWITIAQIHDTFESQECYHHRNSYRVTFANHMRRQKSASRQQSLDWCMGSNQPKSPSSFRADRMIFAPTPVMVLPSVIACQGPHIRRGIWLGSIAGECHGLNESLVHDHPNMFDFYIHPIYDHGWLIWQLQGWNGIHWFNPSPTVKSKRIFQRSPDVPCMVLGYSIFNRDPMHLTCLKLVSNAMPGWGKMLWDLTHGSCWSTRSARLWLQPWKVPGSDCSTISVT